jgi:tetratricopeptide (TPR) repeat protein
LTPQINSLAKDATCLSECAAGRSPEESPQQVIELQRGRAMGSRLSLCMIVRDEERNLPLCLEPLRSLVDEIVVVDTGSTDGTRDAAARLGAKVYDFKWIDDFSAARNESLRHATGDWVLWLDADDRLDSENQAVLAALRERIDHERADLYAVQVLSTVVSASSSGCLVTQARLFRRTQMCWRRRVHEELVPVDPNARLAMQASELVIHHVGYENPARRRAKLHRDLRLLQLDYAVNPDDPLTLFHLAWEHLELGNFTQTVRYARRGLSRNPDLPRLYSVMAQAQSKMNRKQEALATCDKGLVQIPDDQELLYYRGVLQGELGDLAGAEQSLVKLINLPPQRYFFFCGEMGLQTEKARFMLGLLYQQQGRWSEAELQFRTALRQHPRSSQAWLGLGQLYLAAKHAEGFAHAVAELRQCPMGEVLAPVLEARWRMERHDLVGALRLLEQAIACDPQMVWPRLVLSDLAIRGGVDRATAIRIHREILELDPEHRVVRERLEMLLRPESSVHSPPASDEPEAGWSVAFASR